MTTLRQQLTDSIAAHDPFAHLNAAAALWDEAARLLAMRDFEGFDRVHGELKRQLSKEGND